MFETDLQEAVNGSFWWKDWDMYRDFVLPCMKAQLNDRALVVSLPLDGPLEAVQRPW
jgi:hypothetical protein